MGTHTKDKGGDWSPWQDDARGMKVDWWHRSKQRWVSIPSTVLPG